MAGKKPRCRLGGGAEGHGTQKITRASDPRGLPHHAANALAWWSHLRHVCFTSPVRGGGAPEGLYGQVRLSEGAPCMPPVEILCHREPEKALSSPGAKNVVNFTLTYRFPNLFGGRNLLPCRPGHLWHFLRNTALCSAHELTCKACLSESPGGSLTVKFSSGG